MFPEGVPVSSCLSRRLSKVSKSDPIFSQITASPMDLEAGEILCEPFKSKLLFPTALTFPYANPTGFQSQMLLVQNPQSRELTVGLRHSVLRKNL